MPSSRVILHDGGPSPVIDLVFVHGLRGDLTQTWTKGSTCWPKSLLPLDIPNARIITWGYDSSVVHLTEAASQASIFTHAGNLLADITGLRRAADQSASALKRPIIFLAHSLGGLVVKQALIRSSEFFHNKQSPRLGSILPNTIAVIFYGTPHRGSDKTPLAEFVSKVAKVALKTPNDRLVEALKRDNQILEALGQSFSSIGKDLKLVCFWEEKPVTGVGTVVPQSSAVMDGFNVLSNGIPDNHMDMCKFDNREQDDGYRRTCDYLLDFIEPLENASRGPNWSDDHLEVIYDSLYFPEIDDRWERIVDPHEKTFDWILSEEVVAADGSGRRHKRFNDLILWLKTTDPLFWIQGKAASGKSTLMKYLQRRLEFQDILNEQLGPYVAKVIVGSFFFYDQGKTQLQMSREGLLRSLLRQLLRPYAGIFRGSRVDGAELLHQVLAYKCRHVFEGLSGRRKSPADVEVTEIRWSWSDLSKTFEIFAAQKPKTLAVFLLIDGLDEFRLLDNFDDYLDYTDDENSPQARRNIEAHRAIANFFMRLSSHPGFKLCLSSRPLQIFEDTFGKMPGFKLQDLTYNDIHAYVQDNLGCHPRMQLLLEQNQHGPSNIIQEVCSRADGVFLWVRLVVRILLEALDAGDSLEVLEKKIQELPPAIIQHLYAKILQDIEPQYRKEGCDLFGRVLSAMRPLTALSLSFSRVAESAAIDQEVGHISPESYTFRVDEINRVLKSRCNGLLEIVPNPQSPEFAQDLQHTPWNFRPHDITDPIVNFVHRTFLEYLQDPRYSDGDYLRSQMREDVDKRLIISRLLRIKLIGRTTNVPEIGVAFSDALFYAQRVEAKTKRSPIALLQNLGQSARDVWEDGMSAGRIDDYDKDPGYGRKVIEARKKKSMPVGSVNHHPSAYGPRFCDCQDREDGYKDIDFYSAVAQHGLNLFLTAQIERNPAYFREGLGAAIVLSMMGNARETAPAITELLLVRCGLDPNMIYKGSKLWHAVFLKHTVFMFNPGRESDPQEAAEKYYKFVRPWADVIELLIIHGADVEEGIVVNHVAKSLMEILIEAWRGDFSGRRPIADLALAICKALANNGQASRELLSLSSDNLIAIDEISLATQLQLKRYLRGAEAQPRVVACVREKRGHAG